MQVTTSEGEREWLVIGKLFCSAAMWWQRDSLVDDRKCFAV